MQITRKNSVKYVGALFLSVILFTTCRHLPEAVDPGTALPGSTGRTCSVDSVYFANDILPLINSTCAMSGCHDAVTRKEEVQLTNYTTIMQYVVPGDAGNSKINKVILKWGNERMPPPPKPALTADQIAKIQKWIKQGALNNACDRCDTIDFKFSTAVSPILQGKCQGCHNASLLSGGVDLSTYPGVKAAALSGKLYNSLTWTSGTSPMPKTGFKIPECEITQIKKWIDSGTPNN